MFNAHNASFDPALCCDDIDAILHNGRMTFNVVSDCAASLFDEEVEGVRAANVASAAAFCKSFRGEERKDSNS